MSSQSRAEKYLQIKNEELDTIGYHMKHRGWISRSMGRIGLRKKISRSVSIVRAMNHALAAEHQNVVYNFVLDLVKNPRPPSPRLVEAMKRHDEWKKGND